MKLGLYIRGRVSKYATNGSKTAVMDVIVFLCVSLGSSAVQLHDSIGSRRACTCPEAGLVVKMATVVEDRTTKEQRSVAIFFGGGRVKKDSVQRIFIKKCFLFTVGSVYRVKRLTTGWRNSLKDVRKSQMMLY
jgi:hypothetical protein